MSSVAEIIRKASHSGERVAAWDDIQKLLLDNALAFRSHVPPEMVGVHPENRSRLGLSGIDAHHHGQQILPSGFSWAKAADAAAFEVPVGEGAEEARQINDEMVAISGGLLPPLAQLRLLSVGGGHTNGFLRAVKAGCRSAVPGLADASGNLNPAQLSIDRPAFKEAMDKGLNWLVMHHQCPKVWSDLVHLVQAALNTHAKADQSELEVMADIGRMRDAAVAANKEPNWNEIEAAAVLCLPKCASYVSTLCAYVRAQAPELLGELNKCHKAFGSSEYIAKVASLTWGLAEKHPYVLNAAMATNLASPPHRVTDGFCRLLTASTLNALTVPSNREAMKQADKLMADARALCLALGVQHSDRVKCCGKVDVRVVLHLCKKGKEGEGKVFDDIGQIAQAPLHGVTDAAAAHVHQHMLL